MSEQVPLYCRLMAATVDKMPNLAFAKGLIEEARAALWAQQEEIYRLRRALDVARQVCGRNNCNCPGSGKVKAAGGAFVEALRAVMDGEAGNGR